ncbi:uncharacterized protein EV420DRAFT_251641 [Desarmillaria tabescens]|uniref:Uncharacterized protein n=1 Tax=Armillaria tabescens TaxID=1929756 RepID=A0AA39KFK5_ARMTA|nr:uncharacterized protein EV420DRAFT_251641 [Desarmillaria tabescens]KAK0460107.1 hypothetical protein EV420DRAFT_251641 [Desarmillaria tabescens]
MPSIRRDIKGLKKLSTYSRQTPSTCLSTCQPSIDSLFATMRFSLATFIPLAVLAVPALSGAINAGAGIQARDDYYYGNKDYDHKDYGKIEDYDHKDKECTWEPVFEHKNDWNGWKKGKYTPYNTGYVKKESFEIDCKERCKEHDKCKSCQVYSLEEAAEEFICELFEEIVDILTWEDDCDDDYKHDGKKYYDSSCWNAYYY